MNEDMIREEKAKLYETVSRIDELIRENEDWMRKGKDEVSVNPDVAPKVRVQKEKQNQEYREARFEPYFGRVNFQKRDSQQNAHFAEIGHRFRSKPAACSG